MKKLKNTRKLLIAATALVAAVAVSAGATYAWFTSNDTVAVSNISATVKSNSGENLMIAVGHGESLSFKTSLDSSDFGGYTAKVTLDAVTYNGTSKTMQIASVESSQLTYSDTTAGTTEATGTYVKIPLTLRTTKAQSIYLGDTSSVTGNTSASSTVTASDEWMDMTPGAYTYSGKTYQNGDTLTAYVENAARVGITTLTTAGGDESTLSVWSPNEAMFDGSEYSTGTVNRSGVTTDENNYYKNNLAGRYFEYVNGLTTETITQAQYSNYFTTYSEASDASRVSLANVATTAEGTDDSYYAYIYIYIWVEGTDGDCFNNILEQTLNTTIAFTVNTSNS